MTTPWLDLRLGDALTILGTLPAESVHCVVTSPPYWGLRDYGHDLQIGREATPEQYVADLVDIFEEVRRVLVINGTVWLNLGDSYCSSGGERASGSSDGGVGRAKPPARRATRPRGRLCGGYATIDASLAAPAVHGLKPKDLIGIPWRVAFALQAAGWYLRADIIWSKPNPMPESVQDRPTGAHEYLFLLAKAERYFYDFQAAAEPAVALENRGGNRKLEGLVLPGRSGEAHGGLGRVWQPDGTRNRRSVWEIPTEPYAEAHFATYPPDLIKPCILAGCPEGGVVLDPFLGSGTTAMVANLLGRRAIGIELNPAYLALAQKRCSQITIWEGANAGL